ncbi:MAG TPA: hypothetical protein VGB46_09375 [Flavisolibacter sp.]
MKRLILCGWMLVCLGMASSAQTTRAKTPKKQPAAKTATAKKTTKAKQRPTTKTKPAATPTGSTADRTYTYSNSTSHSAYTAPPAAARLQIADPTIRTLNARAGGADIRLSGSGVVGMPRGTYGFAKGRITLMPGGARTSGTQTGSGATGTGTSPGSAGSFGPAMGTNGKNPYGGPWLWSSGNNTQAPSTPPATTGNSKNQ